MNKPAIIVDMDGTLANVDHRLHYIATKPRNYNAFEAECHKDPVNEPVAEVVRAMAATSDYYILIVSARQGDRQAPTEKWLKDNTIPYDGIYMRTQGDTRKDDVVKLELLDKIRKDGYNPVFAVDDRKRVKRMWVQQGIFVFDVNQTDKEY